MSDLDPQQNAEARRRATGIGRLGNGHLTQGSSAELRRRTSFAGPLSVAVLVAGLGSGAWWWTRKPGISIEELRKNLVHRAADVVPPAVAEAKQLVRTGSGNGKSAVVSTEALTADVLNHQYHAIGVLPSEQNLDYATWKDVLTLDNACLVGRVRAAIEEGRAGDPAEKLRRQIVWRSPRLVQAAEREGERLGADRTTSGLNPAHETAALDQATGEALNRVYHRAGILPSSATLDYATWNRILALDDVRMVQRVREAVRKGRQYRQARLRERRSAIGPSDQNLSHPRVVAPPIIKRRIPPSGKHSGDDPFGSAPVLAHPPVRPPVKPPTTTPPAPRVEPGTKPPLGL